MNLEFSNALPRDIDAENAVLGSAMLDREALEHIAYNLVKEDFYDKKNAIIFETMVKMNNQNKLVDLLTLSDMMKSDNTLDVVGGSAYLNALMSTVYISVNYKEYTKIIKSKSTLRHLIQASKNIMEESYKGKDEEEILKMAENDFFAISQNKFSNDLQHISHILEDSYSKIVKMSQSKGQLTGRNTGFIDLNKVTSGFQSSDLILLAARPSMGKTAFALNLCTNVAREGNPVIIFSLEMSGLQLIQRILATQSMIELNKIKTGNLDSDDWIKLIDTIKELKSLPIYIDDTPGISVNEVRSKLRRIKMNHEVLGMVMIDYLQLMTGSGTESRQLEVSNISRNLKIIAREMNCPLISLSQLSRGPESREDKRPFLSDLRDSGAIEQDADIVMFLYRDFYYHREKLELKNTAELIIAKHRNGEVGKIDLFWSPEHQRFGDKYKEE